MFDWLQFAAEGITSVRMLIAAIEAFVGSWNQNAAPFEWTKAEVTPTANETLLL